MGKKISKIITLLFLLAATLGGGVAGYAEDSSVEDTDTVIRPAKGDLTIHKYWAETATEIGDEGNGTDITDDIENPAIEGIQFDVYLMTPADEDTPETPPSDKDGWSYSRAENELTVTDGETTYIYTLTLQTADTVYDGKTDANGVLKYTDLDAGYYYVEENLAASTDYKVAGDEDGKKVITSASKPFIVAVPMTHPDGDKWNSDVHVYPKNQGLNPEKKPNVPSVTVGQEVEWTITANVPSDIATYTKFDIIDELDQRLNFVANSVVVKGLDANGDDLVDLDIVDDYVVTVTPADVDNKETIKISLTTAGIAKLAAAKDIAKLSVSFATTVNGNIAVDEAAGNNDPNNIIKNDATIEFENDSTTETETITTPPTEVETGEIVIDKKASDGETDLTGAEFQLAPSSDDANAETFFKVLLDETDTYIVAILAEGDEGYDSAYNWVIRPHATSGLGYVEDDATFYAASFEGLQTHSVGENNVKTWNSYWVVETKAPNEYNLLGSPVQVTFKTGLTHCVLTETVINKKGFTLPNTGGVGAILLVVSGIVLIGLAVILTMNNKKKPA